MIVRFNKPTRPASFIVCEQSDIWTIALRRAGLWALNYREIRSLDECWAALAEAPASLVAMELASSNIDQVCLSVARLDEEFPFVRTIILGRRGMEHYEDLMRELGAVHFTTSPRNLRPAVELVQQWIDRHAPDAPSDRQSILASLPWSNLA